MAVSGPSNWRLALGCLLVPFMPMAALLAIGGLVLTAFFVANPGGFFDGFRLAPSLPSWAYPDGDMVDHYSSCSGNLKDPPPCRTLVFGTNSSFASVEDAVELEFTTRDWTVHRGPGDLLYARSPNDDACILYLADSREEVDANATKYLSVDQRTQTAKGFWSKYSSRLTVTVDDCSFKG